MTKPKRPVLFVEGKRKSGYRQYRLSGTALDKMDIVGQTEFNFEGDVLAAKRRIQKLLPDVIVRYKGEFRFCDTRPEGL